MRWIALAIVALAAVACSSTPPIVEGQSALRVWIVAQPKTGYAFDNGGSGDAYYGESSTAAPSSGSYALVDYRKLENVVVWAQPAGATNAAGAAPPVSIDIAGAPDGGDTPVFATGTGGSVTIRNQSGTTMDVYALHENDDDAGFDLGEITPGSEASATVDKPGIYEVLSNDHDQPIAQLFVASSSAVAVGRSGRNVRFANLAPGRYEVACGHPRLPGSRRVVELAPGEQTTVSLKVTVNALAASR